MNAVNQENKHHTHWPVRTAALSTQAMRLDDFGRPFRTSCCFDGSGVFILVHSEPSHVMSRYINTTWPSGLPQCEVRQQNGESDTGLAKRFSFVFNYGGDNLIALLVWDVNIWNPWEDGFVGRFGGLLGSYVYIGTTGKFSHHPPSSFVVGIQGASEEG